MRVEHESGQCVVHFRVCLILNHSQDIETRKDRIGQFNIVVKVAVNSVDSTNWVSSSDDGASGLELSDNTSLGDRDSLLLHGFVDTGSVLLVHLVELINQADTFISQYESTSFKSPFSSDGILVDSSSQTHCTRSLTSSVHYSVVELFSVLQELRFGSTRISQEQDITVSTDSVFAVNILSFSTEHSDGKGLFDKLVSVDRGGDRHEDVVGDVRSLGVLADLFFVLVSQVNDIFVTETFKVVNFNVGLEDWEAMTHVREVIKSVDVDSCNFNFISRSGSVNEVVKDVDFLLAGHTTWRDTSRSLLYSNLLVVTVDSLLLVEFIRAESLADNALAQELFGLISRAVESRSFQVTTLTPEVHFLKLREDTRSLGDYTSELNQGVQMDLTQVTELVLNREVSHSHENVIVDLVVVGVDFEDGVHGDFIQNWEHEGGLFSQPDSKGRLLSGQVSEVDFNALLVVFTHLVNPGFVHFSLVVVLECAQESTELSADECIHFFSRNPLRDGTRGVGVIVGVIVRITSFTIVASFVVTVRHSGLLSALSVYPLHHRVFVFVF